MPIIDKYFLVEVGETVYLSQKTMRVRKFVAALAHRNRSASSYCSDILNRFNTTED